MKVHIQSEHPGLQAREEFLEAEDIGGEGAERPGRQYPMRKRAEQVTPGRIEIRCLHQFQRKVIAVVTPPGAISHPADPRFPETRRPY